MTELLNSYTFEAKKIVYYSVTVGAENKTEAKRIASVSYTHLTLPTICSV